MPDRRRNSSRWLVLALATAALVAVAAIVFFRVRQFGPSADEVRQLVQERNVALGYLENQQLDDAAKSFGALALKLPRDNLPQRNLAIARTLAIGDDGAELTPQRLQAATAALQEVARREGQTADFHWLMLHVALAARDFDAAERELTAILQAAPDDAPGLFSKFRASQLAAEGDLDPAALVALERACELRPENAWLRLEWLRTVGTELVRTPGEPPALAADRDPAQRFQSLEKQLALTRTAIEPFAPVILVHTKVDALALLGEAEHAVQARQWRVAGQKLLTLGNVLLPHAALDRLLVQRHPLEFVATAFDPEVENRLPLGQDESPIAVTFVESLLTEATSGPQEAKMSLAGATDLALADFDLDGRLDIFLVLPGQIVVLSRGNEGESWQVVANAAVAGVERLLVQDLDADFDETALAVRVANKPATPPAGAQEPDTGCSSADVDIVAYGSGGIALLENRFEPMARSRTFVAISQEKLPDATSRITALTAADLEGDGDLDLAFAKENKLHRWINAGDWRFAAGPSEERPNVTELMGVDLDRDVDIDLLVASSAEAGWLENLRHGQFRWRSFAKEFPDLAQAKGLEIADIDGNASWDFLGATDQGLRLVTTLTPQPGDIRQHQSMAISNTALQQLTIWDYDNDGYEDLLAVTPAGTTIARSQPAGSSNLRTWSIDQPQFTTGLGARSLAAGDLDGDGDLDTAALNDEAVVLISNDGGNQNHWIKIALQAQQIKGQQIAPSGRVSPNGVGCLLELKAGNRYQARVVRGQSTQFGIGQAAQADVIRVLWLNGIPQNLIQPAANTFVCEQQLLNTSCPYLYTWNGERFEFVTDLLWNAPLGLQLAEGVLAPPRDWEYLKIPGEKLVPNDGNYVLQITEELWEAAYFDQVRLIAVDHPAEVQIFSNEKVGPPSLAEFKIHTVTRPHAVVSARNHNGRDLLADVAREDADYAQVHDRKLRQGVVEEGYLELDLGDLHGATNVRLFLTGWVYPSSTSINVALSQGGSITPPAPPLLLVPDGRGGWKVAQPFMGFPGGKTKTIAVDLTGILAENDGRLRIATSMEFYWDHIFFTADDPGAEVQSSELELISADLHERGYSQVVPVSGNAPEQFFYDKVSREPKWPTMHGAFTRLGNVKPLLDKRDDLLLVIGAGDEVTVMFRVPAKPLPPGWQRDFLLYNAGWEKDCNVLTVLGETVEPLPFQAMSAYPWPPGELVPDSTAHREYLRQYQTRRQSPSFWRSIQRFP